MQLSSSKTWSPLYVSGLTLEAYIFLLKGAEKNKAEGQAPSYKSHSALVTTYYWLEMAVPH